VRTWLPQSIAGQALASTIGLILLAQIISTLILGVFVLRPQAQRVGSIVAHSIAAVSVAAADATPETRAALIERLGASDYLDVWRGPEPPDVGGPAPRFLERTFMQALVDALGPGTILTWRTDPQRQLWLEVQIGPELVWMTSRVPTAMQPISALVWSAVVAFLLSLLGAVALQRRIARPLEALEAAVARPHPAELPVDPRGASEVKALTQAFNAMHARVALVEQERVELLAGVSHDIRTPLAKLRLAVEMLAGTDDGLSAAAHRHVEEIDRLLGQFLVFARGPDAGPSQFFDGDALISEVVALREVDGFSFAVQGPPIGQLYGHPESLRRALVNFTENATRYGATPFSIVTQINNDDVVLAVRDQGTGVPQEALARLAEPFVRGRSGAGGSGLGLAIAAQAARFHGGTLRLMNLSPVGFEAALVLPRGPAEGN
jgi:two-component system, OmpR family, osmolarity sensor histidine kinase EnvZ